MAHRMCAACRIRSQTLGSSDDLVCPDCGSLLEPVETLASIVGFRSVSPVRGLDQFDSEFDEPWDGDGLAAAAVSLPWPDTSN